MSWFLLALCHNLGEVFSFRFLMAYKIVIYLTISGALDLMNFKYLPDIVLGFTDTMNYVIIYWMTITCPKLAVSNAWARKTLMEASLAEKWDIIQCFQRGGECVMCYEVYCNQLKHQCLKHSPCSQGIHNLVSKLEGNFNMVSKCHEPLKSLEQVINCPKEQGRACQTEDLSCLKAK